MEDLPVLVFVLLGTMAVISTSVWVIEERAEIRAVADADVAADRLLDTLLLEMSRGEARSISMTSLRGINASKIFELCPDVRNWQVSILVIHPWVEVFELNDYDSARGLMEGTGYANRIINATYGVNGSALVEVRCVVWKA